MRVNLLLTRALLAEDTFDALEILSDVLTGRILAQDIINPETGEIALTAGSVLDEDALIKLGESGADSLTLRGCTLTLSHGATETIKLGTPSESERATLRHAFIHEHLKKELVSTGNEELDEHLKKELVSMGNEELGISNENNNSKFQIPNSKLKMLTHEMLEKLLDDENITEILVRQNNIRGIEVEAIVENRSEELSAQLQIVDGYLTAAQENTRGVIEPLSERIIGRVLAEYIYDKHHTLIARVNDTIDDTLAEKICASLTDRHRIKVAVNDSFVLAAEDFHSKDGKLIAIRNEELGISNDNAFQISNSKLLTELTSPDKVLIRSVLTCKSAQGVCKKCYGQDLANRCEVEVGEAVGIIAAQSIGEPGTQLTMRTFHTGGVAGGDITQGLPRVEELFEARKPKMSAIISEISGTVSIGKSEKNDLKTVIVTPLDSENQQPREYTIPFGITPRVKEGDTVHPGDNITEGPKNPHDILRICGLKETHRYLVKEVQKVYKSQGVEINDKHIEVMVRQMLHKVKIEESGSTDFLPGEFIDMNVFEAANTKAIEEDRAPAVAKPILLGITKASLATDSFLSAASFQETTRVLTDAAIKGKIDPLIGLKENVIIGKLIPAGTGMARYRELTVVDKEAVAE